MKSIVVDASVMVKCLVPEPDSDLAAALIEQELKRLAPDFLLIECGNALLNKVRQKHLKKMEAEEIIMKFHTLPISLSPTNRLTSAALVLALDLNQSVYDCLYLALAITQDTYVITADKRLYNTISKTALREYVRFLGDYRNN